MKNYLIYLAYSITLMTAWPLLMFGGYLPIGWGTFTALCYTFYSAYEIRKLVAQETISLRWVKLSGPIFIILTFLYLNSWYWFSIINPLHIAFFVLVGVTFLDPKTMPTRLTQFFVVSFIAGYSMTFVNDWKRLNLNASNSKIPNFELNEPFADTKLVTDSNLSSLQFLNKSLDSIQLNGTGKYTLIETWNERCVPCVRAMKDLKDYYDTLGNTIQQKYVYVAARPGVALDYTKIFSYKHISHQDRILVNINMQEELGLQGYPNFLLFDPTGKLILKQLGYAPSQKDKFIAKIKKTTRTEATQ